MSAHSLGETRSRPLPLPEAWKPSGLDTMIRVAGSGLSFRCEECGCNVFKEVEPSVYSCNGCGVCYEGEGK